MVRETETQKLHSPGISAWRRTARYLWRDNPALLLGGMITGIVICISLVGPFITPYDPLEQHILDRLQGPSLKYLFGTDQYGRDVFSRVLAGGRTALLLGLGATGLGLLLGVPIGLTAAYLGKKTDEICMRLMDALLSFPSLLMALLVLTALGSNVENAILAIGIVYMPRIARIIRSATLSVKQEEFVLAAQARGESSLYIMFGEILPNVLPPVIVEGSIRIGFAILVGASLSFLGLGVQPPQADWGLMIKQARIFMFQAPWLVIWPSIALALTIIGFNLLGDGLRDLLHPHVQSKGAD